MKKTKIVLLAAGILLLVGCGNKTTDNQSQNQKQAQTQEKVKGGIVTSIKDAMGLGNTMRCTYKIKSKDGEMESISYVKGENYLTETNIDGIMQKMLFNGKGMYSWSEKEKKGTKMSLECIKEMEKSIPESMQDKTKIEPNPTGEDAFKDAMDVQCEESNDVDFSVPTDINFVDQCEMVKKMMDNLRTMDASGIGAGVPKVPNMPNIKLP